MKAIKRALRASLPEHEDTDISRSLLRKDVPGTLEWALEQACEMRFGKQPVHPRESIEQLEERYASHSGGGNPKVKVIKESAMYPGWTTPHGEFPDRSEKHADRSPLTWRPVTSERAVQRCPQPLQPPASARDLPQPSHQHDWRTNVEAYDTMYKNSPSHSSAANRKKCSSRREGRSESRRKAREDQSRIIRSPESTRRTNAAQYANDGRRRQVHIDGERTPGALSTASGSLLSRSQRHRAGRSAVPVQAPASYEQRDPPRQVVDIPQAPFARQCTPRQYANASQTPAQAQQQYVPAQKQYALPQYNSSASDAGSKRLHNVGTQASFREVGKGMAKAASRARTPNIQDRFAPQPTSYAASRVVSVSSLGEPNVIPIQSSHAASGRQAQSMASQARSGSQQHAGSRAFSESSLGEPKSAPSNAVSGRHARSTASQGRSVARDSAGFAAPTESSLGFPKLAPSNASSARLSNRHRSQLGSSHAADSAASSALSLGEPKVEPLSQAPSRSSQRSKATSSSSSSRASTSTVKADGREFFAAPADPAPSAGRHTFNHIRETAPRAPSIDSQGNERGTQPYDDHKLEKIYKLWDQGIGAVGSIRKTRATPSVWSEICRRTASGGQREHVYERGQRYHVAPCDAISQAGGRPFRERPWHNPAAGNACSTIYTQHGTVATASNAPSFDPTERGSDWWERGGVEADPDAYAESATASHRTYWTSGDPIYDSVSPEQDEDERLAEIERIQMLKDRYREANAADGQL